MPLYGGYRVWVSRACILESHRDGATCEDIGINAGNSLIIDLRHVVDKIILLMHLLEGVVENEANQFWYLLHHVLPRVANGVPHDQVASYCLQENMIGIALLYGVETVGNRYFVCQLQIVRLQVHKRNG
jgi:hypothetical protein